MALNNPMHPKADIQFAGIISCLKGIGQIMLQDNALTGFLFLIGVLVGSVKMGIAIIAAVCIATIVAHIFKYDTESINKGLYGFNAALIGAALVLLYQPTVIIWCSIIVGAIISVVLQHFFITKRITVFTLPFVLVTWGLIFFIDYFSPEIKLTSTMRNVLPAADFGFALRGYSQVIFQENRLAGAIFFVGVFINSPIAALYGLCGAVLAGYIAFPLGVPIENIKLGLASYNAVLCAIAFAEIKLKAGIWALLSVVLASVISVGMNNLSFPQFTFPFVAASCVVLILKSIFPSSETNYP